MKKLYHSNELNKRFLEKLKEEIKKKFKGCKRIAVKIHFGELGNKTALKPEDVEPIINILRESGFNYFLYDSSVAYGGERGEPDTHKKYALNKGWGKTGEIITEEDYIDVKGNSMNYQVCKILTEADGVLVVSHFKGHECPGFGGAIKNLGMGAMTKKTKKDIHEGGKPIYTGKCTLCKSCEIACPNNLIKVTDKPYFENCGGCSDCIYACPAKVLKPKTAVFDRLLAEGANAAQSKFRKFYYINLLIRITKRCDCYNDSEQKIAEDCGFIAGEDGVALDQASYDLVCKKAGEDVFLKWHKKSGVEQIKEAEKLGMGSSKYKLVKV